MMMIFSSSSLSLSLSLLVSSIYILYCLFINQRLHGRIFQFQKVFRAPNTSNWCNKITRSDLKSSRAQQETINVLIHRMIRFPNRQQTIFVFQDYGKYKVVLFLCSYSHPENFSDGDSQIDDTDQPLFGDIHVLIGPLIT